MLSSQLPVCEWLKYSQVGAVFQVATAESFTVVTKEELTMMVDVKDTVQMTFDVAVTDTTVSTLETSIAETMQVREGELC